MFDGKMFLALTGTPIRNIVLATIVLAEALPEPLTVANLITKSLMPLICVSSAVPVSIRSSFRPITGFSINLVDIGYGHVDRT